MRNLFLALCLVVAGFSSALAAEDGDTKRPSVREREPVPALSDEDFRKLRREICESEDPDAYYDVRKDDCFLRKPKVQL